MADILDRRVEATAVAATEESTAEGSAGELVEVLVEASWVAAGSAESSVEVPVGEGSEEAQ